MRAASAGYFEAVGIRLRAGRLFNEADGHDVLFGVHPTDVVVLVAVAGVLLVTTIAANGVPAHRAARIDPMRSLRTE